jgi:hypothetical protein
MRKIDKLKNLQKINILVESRYINESGGHSSMFNIGHKQHPRIPKEGEVPLSTLDIGDIFVTSDGHNLEFRVFGKDPNGGIAVQYTDYKGNRPNYSMRDDVMVIKK